jgi:hypothetical protein
MSTKLAIVQLALHPPPESGKIERMSRRFQFSIRAILAATAAVAAAIAAIRSEPTALSVLAIDFLSAIFGIVAIVGVTRSSGKLRTFWIGTNLFLVPNLFQCVGTLRYAAAFVEKGNLTGENGWFVGVQQSWIIWCAAPIGGLVGVCLHWLLWQQSE